MLLHHLNVGMRALARRPGFTLINIGGLALGLAAALLIALFAREELSWDRWIPDAERIVRVQGVIAPPGREPFLVAGAPPVQLGFVLQDFAEVEAGARLLRVSATVQLPPAPGTAPGAAAGPAAVSAEPLAMVDPSFFEVLALPVLAGDARAAIREPNALALTRSASLRLLGTADALGREITITDLGRTRTLRVLAVLQDLPRNTHLVHQLYTRWDEDAIVRRIPQVAAQSWSNAFSLTYLKLKPGARNETLNAGWQAFQQRRIPPDARVGDVPVRDMQRTVSFRLTELHLRSNGIGELKPPGSARQLAVVSAIGALVLLVACFNFVNLSTALASQREREVALRRTLGAKRGHLMAQFLVEAVLIAAAAGLLALVLAEAALPWWRLLLERPDAMSLGLDDPLLLAYVPLVLATGLLAGLYPALVLSRVQPALVLHTRQGGSSARLRQLLVGLQFALVVALAAGTLGVLQQGRHLAKQDLGYAEQDLVFMRGLQRSEVREQSAALLAQWRALPEVAAVARARGVPGNSGGGGFYLQREASASGSGAVVSFDAIDEDAITTFGMQLLAGRGFARTQALDDMSGLTPQQLAARGGHLLLNETAVQRLGLGSPEAAIGQRLRMGMANDVQVPMTVIGVLRNVRFGAPTEVIEPSFFMRDDGELSHFVIRLRPGADAQAAQQALEQVWRRNVPQVPPQIVDIRTVHAEHREGQRRAGWVLALAAVLAVAIGCLGLLGLAAHKVHSRAS